MKWFKNIFRRKSSSPEEKGGVGAPLRIEGIGEAPLTPEPDDAELAAQALLELMSLSPNHSPKGEGGGQPEPANGTAEYYRHLADRIREAHRASRLRTMRFLAFCEQELQKRDLPVTGPGSLSLLETELFKRIDTVEREGGDLKRRWQHCLAEVTVRMMNGNGDENENGDGNGDENENGDGNGDENENQNENGDGNE